MKHLGLLIVAFALLVPLPAQAQEIDCEAEELRPWLENYLAWSNAISDVVTAKGGIYDVELVPFLRFWHAAQANLDQPGRPECADALMLETLRNYHQTEHVLLCYRIESDTCVVVVRSADQMTSRAELPIPYIAAAGMTDDEAKALRPEGWNLAEYLYSFDLTPAGEPGGPPKGGRSNPYLTSEWAPFSEGRIRTMPVVDDYQSRRAPTVGMRYIAIPIEYECYQADENKACSGLSGKYVGVDGLVTETPSVYDDPYFSSVEGYTGAILKGNIYFEVPVSAELGQLRLYLGGEHVFFALQPAE